MEQKNLITKNEPEDVIIFDRSLVVYRNEHILITIIKIIGKSLINNIVNFSDRLSITINLILLGHIPLQNKTHYELFMTYQIGVAIIDFLGKLIITGLLKYLFEKKESEELFNLYLRLKSSLIFIIPIIMIPVSICSYFIIKLLLQNNLDIYDQSLNKEVYFKYLLFTPIIYFFEILFYLNLQLLRSFDEIKALAFYLNFFYITHITTCWILLYTLNVGIFGLTASYCLNSFLFYLFSNLYIDVTNKDKDENFIIIPHKEYLNSNIFTCLKEAGTVSLRNLSDSFVFYLLFIASLFTDKNQLIVNIIYLNFYNTLIAINKGSYITLKNYLLYNKEATEKKKNYVVIFSSTFLFISFSLFIILMVFENILLDIYLIDGGEKPLQKISKLINKLFALCVIFNGIQILLYGFIRGLAMPSPLMKKVAYSLITLLLCLLLCFYYDYGIIGLWISVLILSFLYIFENTYKAVKNFRLFFF